MSEAPVFNASQPAGGNPLEVDVNAQYAGLEFNYVYLAICGFLVYLIIPGIGLLYGGLAHKKSGLSLLFQSMMVCAIVTFQWMFWGYSLAFSRTAGPFIGDMANFGLKNVVAAPSPGSAVLPEIVFCLYELMFAACTVQIVVGGAFERGRILPSLIFAFWWCTIVYCPIACWTWNPNGWLAKLPSLDYAGGGPVHISSGWAALAYAMVLGKRTSKDHHAKHKPHNSTLVFVGTVLIIFGWFGFNGGSALNASVRGMMAAFNTQVAASTGVIGWVMVDAIRHKGRFSVVGACEGAIAGLVGITPAAGFVNPWLGAVIGFVTAVVCALLQDINEWLRIDDGLYVFKLHGIGGIMGSFMTGLFANESISALDGVSLYPGAYNGNGIQVAKQLAEIAGISAYSFIVSYILLMIIKYIPGMHLRVDKEAEIRGLDLDQFFDEEMDHWDLSPAGIDVMQSGPTSFTHGVPQTLEGTMTPNEATTVSAEKK